MSKLQKYECKENDAVIFYDKGNEELRIGIDGDSSQLIIGENDMLMALAKFELIINTIDL